MDAKELAKILLDKNEYQELSDALYLLDNKNYGKIYDMYKNMIHELFFVFSYDEFVDFSNSEVINKSIFIFGFLCRAGKCIEVGGYEEEIQKKINFFINQLIDSSEQLIGTSSNINTYTDYDGEDNFGDYIICINSILDTYNMQSMLFFNDVYCVCLYHFFIFNKELVKILQNEWNDVSIKIHR